MITKTILCLLGLLLLATHTLAQDVIRGRCAKTTEAKGPLNFSPTRFECLPAREGS